MIFETVGDFIDSVMSGDVWEFDGDFYYYDETEVSPFRFNNSAMRHSWENVLTEDFEFVEKSFMEERWRMKRVYNNFTQITDDYYNQEMIDASYPMRDGWFKYDMIKEKVLL